MTRSSQKSKIKKLVNIAAAAAAEHWRSGLSWYQKASQAAELLAITHEVDKSTAAGIMAAFTIRSSWKQAIVNTDILLSGGRPRGIFQKQVQIARLIWKHYQKPDLYHASAADLLGYRKSFHFYQCLIKPDNGRYCPLDHWALRPIAGGQKAAELVNTPQKQDRILSVYRAAAAELAILPSQLQAILWLDQKAAAAELRAEDRADLEAWAAALPSFQHGRSFQ
jgi:hypothetical protein